MQTFTDSAGRLWTLQINVDAIKRVRALTKIDLLDVFDGQLIERLASDPICLCDVLFALVKPEADSRSVTDADFGRALAGDVIDLATAALLEELVSFFPQGKRLVLQKALAKYRRLEEKALALARHQLDDPQLEARIEAALSSAGS